MNNLTNQRKRQVMANENFNEKIPLLDSTIIKECIEEKGIIAQIRVKTIALNLKGSRSENINAAVLTEKILFGSTDPNLSLRAFTAKGNLLLTKGGRYIVILSYDPSYAPLWVMDAFIPVSAENEEQQIELHQKVISHFKK